MMIQTRTIDTKQAAALLRAALRHIWPAVLWSVRMDRGTAYGWLSVTWEDGPTDAQVYVVTRRYQSQEFDGMTDTYLPMPDGLAVTGDGQGLPEPVRYAVAGINRHRRIGAAGWAATAAAINAVQPGAAHAKEGGGLMPGWLTEDAAAALDLDQYPGPVDIDYAAARLHQGLDLT